MEMENANLELPENIHPQEKTTFLHLNQSGIFLIGVAVLVILIVLGMVGYWLWVKPSVNTAKQVQNNVNNNPTLIPSPSAKETVTVQYLKREKILETVKTPDEENITTAIFDFYKIGTITSGKYAGSDLILASITFDGPCKSASCGKPIRFRYALKDKIVAFLPKVSAPYKPYHPRDPLSPNVNPFQKFGLSLVTDNDFTIPILEYPKEISGSNAQQVLKTPEYHMEEDGEFATAKLYKVFTHPIFGDIYTTKPEFSPSKSFETEGGGFGARDTLAGCRGDSCFTTNAFFAFRPDGTFLKFAYNPDFSTKDIIWSDSKQNSSEYLFNTVAGCSRDELDHNSVVSPTLVSETDLATIGETKNTGDTIYGLKDQNHKLNTEFYNTYKEYYAGPYIYPEEKRQTKSFSEFINSRPTFLWRDPFSRLIRFNNEEFLPPFACEPIIYLYPQTTQKVSITFDQKVNLSDSIPEYRNGWNVIADPSGKIINLSDNRTYPYLFWEGWSLIFPIQNNGFVVKQSEVASFLEKTLPKLGLNEKEKEDFMKAWLPYFSNSPYYFLTFIEQDAIDVIAPLMISPKPDTVIRVLMDIKPLEKLIEVEELQLKETPQRKGFTVVEWGGLKR